ncbi:tax1-binding protein 1 homolog B-like [Maniola hyperantus]|uniref:tax1-binding protein 1 homolog B-like n=1 Tax=Aphantopus hyperantus TaxID=2795564 RepID=UPI0015699C82|nr:major antigen-like [Maniola hyperantus]
MALKMMQSSAQKNRNNHSVRFSNDELPKFKSLDSPDGMHPFASNSLLSVDSGAPSPDCMFQPAAQRYRLNEQRIKLLTAINQIVQQRADLETNRTTLSSMLEELRRKLKRRIEECHFDKKEKMKALKQANQKLEREKFNIVNELEHLKRHLEKEEAHHLQHARNAVAQAIQGVTRNSVDHLFAPCSVSELPNIVSRNVARNAPSRIADSKLAAARLMRDIAELRNRVAQVEARLANELKRKRQAEIDIVRLRKELSSNKSCVASLRMPYRQQCSKFA